MVVEKPMLFSSKSFHNFKFFTSIKISSTYLELANALELHGFAGEVLARRDSVSEDVEQEGAAAGGVHAERYHVTYYRLPNKNIEHG